MKILFDTNIILDVLLERKPFSREASFLLSRVERSEISGYLCATTVTTIHYLISKALGSQAALRHIQSLLALFIIAPVNHQVLEKAAMLNFRDFEDAVLHEAACHAGIESIVTRNTVDFKKSTLPVFAPADLVAALLVLKSN
ncbi:MAG: PIN domain-containing protein [Candidatus Sabulitectum sp.]|nr:PIN domain-containing protein [Candidatus Sabulitectum sp.]